MRKTNAMLIYWIGTPENRRAFKNVLGEPGFTEKAKNQVSSYRQRLKDPNDDLYEKTGGYSDYPISGWTTIEIVDYFWAHVDLETVILEDAYLTFQYYYIFDYRILLELSERFKQIKIEEYSCGLEIGSEPRHSLYYNGKLLINHESYGSIHAYSLACSFMPEPPNQELENEDLLKDFHKIRNELLSEPTIPQTLQELEEFQDNIIPPSPLDPIEHESDDLFGENSPFFYE